MVNLDSNTLGLGLALVILIVELMILWKVKQTNRGALYIATIVLVGIAIVIGYIYPLQQEEYIDYYSNNIHGVVISSTQPNISFYEKLIRVENVCRIYNNIPLKKCIGFAMDDINGT